LHHNFANAVAASSHDNNLPAPHVCVVAPIVQYCIVEPRSDTSEQTQPNYGLEMLEHSAMLFGEYVSARRIASKEEQWKRERRVKDCELEQSTDGIARDAFARKSPLASRRHRYKV
jgi:hypothetical protein